MNTISTKAMGIALRQLYPGAFASYQGIIFRVTSPQNDILSGVTRDEIKSEKAEDVLIDYPELAEKVFMILLIIVLIAGFTDYLIYQKKEYGGDFNIVKFIFGKSVCNFYINYLE